MFTKLILSAVAIMALGACTELELGSHISKKMSGSHNPNGDFKVGNPYTIKGQTYSPEERYEFSETGVASWYGPGFEGKPTANGEIFRRAELTGAHKTLQMPSIVRVTNLENGRSLIVRINDRGPFSSNRIIDVSEKAAEMLGFKLKGTAKVRIDVLEEESRIVGSAAKRGLSTRGSEIALNKNRDKRDNADYNDNRLISASVYGRSNHPLEHLKVGMKTPVPHTKPNNVPMRVASYNRPVTTYTATRVPVNDVQTQSFQNVLMAQGNQLPVKPSVPMQTFFIQTENFYNEDAAMTFKVGLYNVREPAIIQQVNVGGQMQYKVKIGPIQTVEKANEIRNMLNRQGRASEIIMMPTNNRI